MATYNMAPGQQIKVRLTYKNNGMVPITAHPVVWVPILDPSTGGPGSSGGMAAETDTPLQPGQSATTDFVLTAPANVPFGTTVSIRRAIYSSAGGSIISGETTIQATNCSDSILFFNPTPSAQLISCGVV